MMQHDCFKNVWRNCTFFITDYGFGYEQRVGVNSFLSNPPQ